MPDIIKLAARPTSSQVDREEIVGMLRKALEQAEEGKIKSLAMILGNPDGTWRECLSASLTVFEAIGRLEIVKQELIAQYLEHEASR